MSKHSLLCRKGWGTVEGIGCDLALGGSGFTKPNRALAPGEFRLEGDPWSSLGAARPHTAASFYDHRWGHLILELSCMCATYNLTVVLLLTKGRLVGKLNFCSLPPPLPFSFPLLPFTPFLLSVLERETKAHVP